MVNGKMDPAWESIMKCKKCDYTSRDGGAQIGAKWIEAKTGDEERPERMERTCPICGYSWYERPADAGTGSGG